MLWTQTEGRAYTFARFIKTRPCLNIFCLGIGMQFCITGRGVYR